MMRQAIAPHFSNLREARVVVHVDGHVLRRRAGQDRLFFGHAFTPS